MGERRYPVTGEIDLEVAPTLRSDLLEIVNTTNDDLVIDCDGLQFIDSQGIAAFAYVHRLLEIEGRRLRVVNLAGMPRRAFDLLGLTELLGITEAEPA